MKSRKTFVLQTTVAFLAAALLFSLSACSKKAVKNDDIEGDFVVKKVEPIKEFAKHIELDFQPDEDVYIRIISGESKAKYDVDGEEIKIEGFGEFRIKGSKIFYNSDDNDDRGAMSGEAVFKRAKHK